jgi:hypothetical protein
LAKRIHIINGKQMSEQDIQERTQRHLSSQQRKMGHKVYTIVPEGYILHEVKTLMEWEQGKVDDAQKPA